ncbi:hypothetical protein CORC01_12577 [Colletotrichum orchidophilum]|uniref:C2H2-type domain-containing protein n=1 Tax=Colletotrichum orchidophilum TaxID=1209926 RepID=A0A1G4ASV1_9PEZI|nr:uncharacterized protein CORC01_12577 [Colletotrichum orchidophilum]OHE92122.1 hypothetical protein CORC01_12577 [Colletotrichum orchidophilum]
MSFHLENTFALAILGEHDPQTSTTSKIIYRADWALWDVSSRLLDGDSSLPDDEADTLEIAFTLPMLSEQLTSGVDVDTLVASAQDVWLKLRRRLIRGECILPPPPLSLGIRSSDESINVLFGPRPTFPPAELCVGEYPDNCIHGEWAEDYAEDIESDSSASSTSVKTKAIKTTQKGRKDRGDGMWVCDVGDCGKDYTCKSTLDIHKRDAHGLLRPIDRRRLEERQKSQDTAAAQEEVEEEVLDDSEMTEDEEYDDETSEEEEVDKDHGHHGGGEEHETQG